MRTLFSVEGGEPNQSFRRWREAIRERLVPVDMAPAGDGAFQGRLESADVGPLPITRVTQSPLTTTATADTIRRHTKSDTLSVLVALGGEVTTCQDGRTSVQRPGDVVVIDRRPAILSSTVLNRTLLLEVPRARLESALGPTRHYTALTIDGHRPGATLATGYLDTLLRVHGQLAPATAERAASIGVDLLVAGIAERLARDAPAALRGRLVVERAKAHVEAHLGDVSLDPPRLAAVAGVSLRYLQQLFREHGHHVSDWIWRRRLEVSAQRLADPGQAHLPVGVLAYSCGFTSQAHFSRRFRERFGLTPSEHRFRALGAP